jgi:ABC-type transport system involved in cytochrome c biogenesis permease subunit
MLSQALGMVMLLYLGVALLFLAAGLWASASLNRLARQLLGAGLAAHTAILLARWWTSYHLALGHTPLALFSEKLRLVILQAPMSNFYESLVFFAWCLPFLAILTFRRYLQDYLGTVVALGACLLLAYASLGGVDSRIKPLMPALKSNWLLIHVVTCFLGYAAPPPIPFGPAPPSNRHDRLLAPNPGDLDRRGVGREGLGPLLELGPQGDLVPDHLADLRHPPPRPPG